jgi:hypothetical protein
MADGSDESDPEDTLRRSDDPEPGEGRILSPDELDIEESDHVEPLDEGRYVVSPDARGESVRGAGDAGTQPQPDPTPEAAPEEPTFSDAAVHEWLQDDLADTNSRYGFDVTAKFGNNVSQQQMVSNDIVTVFESLMLWYTRKIDGDTPVEEVLGILLSESNVPVKYPPESLERLVRSTGLTSEDTIGELIDAVEDN